jgi:hypothetical protein
MAINDELERTLWCIDLLLGRDFKANGGTTAVAW